MRAGVDLPMAVERRHVTPQSRIQEFLVGLGFDPVGFARADPLPAEQEQYAEWIRRRYHGGMKYLETHAKSKFNPTDLLRGAKSVIMVGMNYHQTSPADTVSAYTKDRGRVAKYAWGRDYHKVVGGRLKRAVKDLESVYPEESFRSFVDILPIAERLYAARSGIGFLGRNTLLITRKYGSWVFLGGILTTLELLETAPEPEVAGMRCPSGCTRCIDACPTDALYEPHRIDASKCISYLTIERKGSDSTEAERESETHSGEWLFGCDVCQQVCPFNLKPEDTGESDFTDWIAGPRISIDEIENSTASRELFVDRFAGSPVMRAGPGGMRRNARVVARNFQSKSEP